MLDEILFRKNLDIRIRFGKKRNDVLRHRMRAFHIRERFRILPYVLANDCDIPRVVRIHEMRDLFRLFAIVAHFELYLIL